MLENKSRKIFIINHLNKDAFSNVVFVKQFVDQQKFPVEISPICVKILCDSIELSEYIICVYRLFVA